MVNAFKLGGEAGIQLLVTDPEYKASDQPGVHHFIQFNLVSTELLGDQGKHRPAQ